MSNMEEDIEVERLDITYVCSICQQNFVWKGNLSRHMKEVHQGEGKLDCDVCKKEVLERHLHTHLKMQHGITRTKKPSAKSNIACPSCSEKFVTLNDLRKHVQEVHGVEQEVEFLTFKDEAEFNSWKSVTEKESNAYFVVKHGKSKSVEGKRQTYHCNRSGTYRPSGRNIRALKSQGTCKLGSYCTASIDVVFRKSKVQVAFHKTHFGHELDVSDLLHVRIPEMDKQLIAGRLMGGATMNDVLEEVCEGNTVGRKALVDKKDLRNIIHKFGLDKRHCELCEFTSPNLPSLRRHMAKTHAHHKDYWCNQCRFKGISRLTLQKHKLKFHPRLYGRTKCMETVITNGVESPCTASFAFSSKLRYHLAHAHGIAAALEEKTSLCSSVEEFFSWKSGYETGTVSQYVARTNKLVVGKPVRHKCARAGVNKPKGESIRRLKAQGSRKIGGDCTSEIGAELLEDGTVRVAVFPFHYGHETGVKNVPHVTMPAVGRDVVKENLLHGLSKKRVIEETRRSLHSPGEGGAVFADKINRSLVQNINHSVQSTTADNLHSSVNAVDSSDDTEQHCTMVAADFNAGDDHQYSLPGSLPYAATTQTSCDDGRRVVKVTLKRLDPPGAPVSQATLDETTAELMRLRGEVAELRHTLRKTNVAHDVERAELLSVFTPRQADILLGHRARSNDWDVEDLRRAIALRRVLTRRQYEHLRLHLRLPLPEVSEAAASEQTLGEKRWLYRRLLGQRLAVEEGQPVASNSGNDVPPGELFVLRSMAEHGLQAKVPELKEEIVEDDEGPAEVHAKADALCMIGAEAFDRTGVGAVWDPLNSEVFPKPARSRPPLKVAVTPVLNQ